MLSFPCRGRDAPGVGGGDARADAGAGASVAREEAGREGVEALALGGDRGAERALRRRRQSDDDEPRARAALATRQVCPLLPQPQPRADLTLKTLTCYTCWPQSSSRLRSPYLLTWALTCSCARTLWAQVLSVTCIVFCCRIPLTTHAYYAECSQWCQDCHL